MKLALSKKANINYVAKIVEIKVFHKHSDPEVERLKCCTIDGFNIITGIDAKEGLYVYFPVLSQLNPELLKYCNLYRHVEMNKDADKTGMFEDNGRVKSIRLRGELSEGFILPIEEFNNFLVDNINKDLDEDLIKSGIEFDCITHNDKEFWICKKYVPKTYQTNHSHQRNRNKVIKLMDKLIERQFRFHYDTIIIKKCPNVIQPEDLISITEKIHGTSGISAYVLCKRPLTWYEKLYKKFINSHYEPTVYDYLYSSRTVIKNRYYNKSVSNGFYNVDVWKYADEYLRPFMSKGMTLYYEIVGYLPDGKYIQKNYDYDCKQPVNNGEPYSFGVHYKVRIYRITLTNVDGNVHEFSAREVQQWCASCGLHAVQELYYGFARDLYPELATNDLEWSTKFIDKLADDKRFFMEELSPSCRNKVAHEGLVIKKENSKSEAFKLKCFKFLQKEQEQLDKGEVNIEDEA